MEARVNMVDRTDSVCVIGAGSSGLAAAKNLLETGIPVNVIEREERSRRQLELQQAHSIRAFIGQRTPSVRKNAPSMSIFPCRPIFRSFPITAKS